MYDIIGFTPEKIDIKKVGMRNRPTASKAESSRRTIPTNSSISQNDSVVKHKDEKFSVDDNERSDFRRTALSLLQGVSLVL